MIVEHEDAQNMRCVLGPNMQCVGRSCMAWLTFWDYHPKDLAQDKYIALRTVKTTKGSCGLVNE